MRLVLTAFIIFMFGFNIISQEELEIKIWKSDTIPNAAEILKAQKTNPQLYITDIRVYSDEIKFTYKTESDERNYSIKQPYVIPSKPVIFTLEDGKNFYIEYKPAEVQPKSYWKRTIQLVLKEGDKLIENFEIEGTEKYNYDHQNIFVAIDKEKQQVILQFYSNENNDAKILFYYDLANKKLISKKKTTEEYYPAGNGEYYALDLSLDQKITVAKYNFNGDKITSFDVATNVNDLYGFTWSSYFKKWYPTAGAFVFATDPDYHGDVTVYVLDNNLRVFNKALVIKSTKDYKIIPDNGSLWLYYLKKDDSNNKTVMRTDLITGRDRIVYKPMFPITAYAFSEKSNELHIGVNTVNKELSNQITETHKAEAIAKKNEEEKAKKLKNLAIQNEEQFNKATESITSKFESYKNASTTFYENIGDAKATANKANTLLENLKSIKKQLIDQRQYLLTIDKEGRANSISELYNNIIVIDDEIVKVKFFKAISEISVFNNTSTTFENDVNNCIKSKGVYECYSEVSKMKNKYKTLIEETDVILNSRNPEYFLAYFNTTEEVETFKTALKSYKNGFQKRSEYYEFIDLRILASNYDERVEEEAIKLKNCIDHELSHICKTPAYDMNKLYETAIKHYETMDTMMRGNYSLSESVGAEQFSNEKKRVADMLTVLNDAQDKLIEYIKRNQ